MRSVFSLLALGAGLIASVAADSKVVGTPSGFAAGTTGGGNAAPQYPKDIAQLKEWISDSTPRVIVLDKEFNFLGSEGSVTANDGCRPDSNTCVGNGGQDAINGANWCSNSVYPKLTVTYDKAGIEGIRVGSNKSILGVGNKGIMRGKGLRISNDVQNIIVQNVHITNLNPQYIWGGDAIAIDGADKVWIDHCQTSLIGRQHIVIGNGKGTHTTISNHYFDGRTSWSASCDGHHYWTAILSGSNSQTTLMGNWFRETSGRSPKIDSKEGSAVVHAVNNWFSSNTGHAFDIGGGGHVVAEGNVFENVKNPGSAKDGGELFATGGSACQSAFGRACQANLLTNSGAFTGTQTGPIAKIGKSAVTASSTRVVVNNVSKNAGIGKIA